MTALEELRQEIDRIDRDLVRLLKQRIEVVLWIREYKKLHDLPVEDLDREKEILDRLEKNTPDSQFFKEIFGLVFKHSKHREI